MKIEILGPGCPKCHQTEKNVKLALKQLGVEAEVGHLYDFKEMAKMGVMHIPAVVVDGEVVMSGHVPTIDQVVKMLEGRIS